MLPFFKHSTVYCKEREFINDFYLFTNIGCRNGILFTLVETK